MAHNSGLALRNLFGANGLFRIKNGASSQLWICCKDFLTILYNERCRERHRNYINGFSEKKKKSLIQGSFAILAEKWYIPLSF